MTISAAVDGGVEQLLAAAGPHLTSVTLAAGTHLFEEGDETDSFYVLDEGDVRFELHSDEVDSDSVLSYAGPGAILGEVGLLTGMPRSATAIAETDVRARRMGRDTLERLVTEDPAAALAIVRVLGREASVKLVDLTHRLAEHLFSDVPDPEVEAMVALAVAAQRVFDGWSEEAVDDLLREIVAAVVARAETLGAATVAETGIGDAADKTEKIRFGSAGVYATLTGRPGRGVIADDEATKVTEVASPVGVVFALAPVTEPVSTYVNKVLMCLKARNAIIVSPHRASKRIAAMADDLVQEVLARKGAPAGLVQVVRERTSRQRTARFMRHPDVGLILATGGAAMVKAAYSSGKPAIGVGAGNAPVWVAASAELDRTAECVVQSKAFDNGLVCGAEQHLVVDDAVFDDLVDRLRAIGTVVVPPDQTAAVVERAFTPEGRLRMEHIGRTAVDIAVAVGLDDPALGGARVLAIHGDPEHVEGPFATERLAPIITLYRVSGAEAAISLCGRLLDHEGRGHTAVVHAEDEDDIQRFAAAMPASRILVNVPAALGCSGVLTGLVPSMTLGCGTFGGNSTTDNVGYRNVMNVKRIARMNFDNALATRRLVKKLPRDDQR